jgi:hypothetical protein
MKKKLIYRFLSLIVIIMLGPVLSCKKYLTETPTASVSTATAFSNVANATESVLGVYAKLAGDSGYGSRLSLYYTVDQDEMVGPANSSAPDGGPLGRPVCRDRKGKYLY